MEIISVSKFAKMIKIAKLPYFAPNMQRQVLTVRINENNALNPRTRPSSCLISENR